MSIIRLSHKRFYRLESFNDALTLKYNGTKYFCFNNLKQSYHQNLFIFTTTLHFFPSVLQQEFRKR